MPRGNPNAVPPRKSRRKAVRDRLKPYDKDKKAGSALRRRARLERTIERCQAELEGSDSEGEYEDVDTATEGEKRLCVKFFWQTLGKPRRQELWGGASGVIAYIRRRIGSTAPMIETVRATLLRLLADEHDDLLAREPVARKRAFSEEEDMYAGLLLCEGHSQRSAL